MEGKHWANMDLPAPGGPTNRRLCRPAAQTSNARFADCCPLISHRSGNSVNVVY